MSVLLKWGDTVHPTAYYKHRFIIDYHTSTIIEEMKQLHYNGSVETSVVHTQLLIHGYSAGLGSSTVLVLGTCT